MLQRICYCRKPGLFYCQPGLINNTAIVEWNSQSFIKKRLKSSSIRACITNPPKKVIQGGWEEALAVAVHRGDIPRRYGSRRVFGSHSCAAGRIVKECGSDRSWAGPTLRTASALLAPTAWSQLIDILKGLTSGRAFWRFIVPLAQSVILSRCNCGQSQTRRRWI